MAALSLHTSVLGDGTTRPHGSGRASHGYQCKKQHDWRHPRPGASPLRSPETCPIRPRHRDPQPTGNRSLAASLARSCAGSSGKSWD